MRVIPSISITHGMPILAETFSQSSACQLDTTSINDVPLITMKLYLIYNNSQQLIEVDHIRMIRGLHAVKRGAWSLATPKPSDRTQSVSTQFGFNGVHHPWPRSGSQPLKKYHSRKSRDLPAAEPALLAEVTGNFGKTGVPVMDSLFAAQGNESLISLATRASLDSTILIAIPLMLSYAVSLLLQRLKKDEASSNVVSNILGGVVRPVQNWLPLLLLAKYATVWFSVLHIVLKKISPVIFGYSSLPSNVNTLAQFFQDSSECILILLICRIILNIKDTILTEIQYASQKVSKKGGEVLGLSRFIDSIKSITSLIGWMIGGYQSLLAFGFNPIPIWTSLGASSIIIGLAAQPLLSNIVSGIAIYSSRVLVVGDHVQLLTAGGSVAIDGYVEVVSPTTCVIRDADDCLIYINNKQMSSMILRNKSQTVVAR